MIPSLSPQGKEEERRKGARLSDKTLTCLGGRQNRRKKRQDEEGRQNRV